MKKIDITDKDTLEHLYNELELSAKQIASMYNICKSAVLRNLRNCNIRIRTANELRIKNKRVLYCSYCGRWIENTRSKQPHRYEKCFCDSKCQGKWQSENVSGVNHPSWKGGSGIIDYGPHWRKNKSIILRRYGNRCSMCGSPNEVEAHHLIPFKMFNCDRITNPIYNIANSLDNLTSLCKTCHGILRRKGASETIILASEKIIEKSQMVAWSELHGDMQNLAEMSKSIIRNGNTKV